MKDVTINVFDPRDMQIKTDEIADYLDDLEEKANQICEQLADIASDEAALLFYSADYEGINDVEVNVNQIPNGYQVQATGDATLFIEFGSGATRGYGHHEPEGYGPGTYPGKGHWNDPKGWYLPYDALGESGVHTFGNPPAEAMYYAKQEAINNVNQVADEVFNS